MTDRFDQVYLEESNLCGLNWVLCLNLNFQYFILLWRICQRNESDFYVVEENYVVDLNSEKGLRVLSLGDGALTVEIVLFASGKYLNTR